MDRGPLGLRQMPTPLPLGREAATEPAEHPARTAGRPLHISWQDDAQVYAAESLHLHHLQEADALRPYQPQFEGAQCQAADGMDPLPLLDPTILAPEQGHPN